MVTLFDDMALRRMTTIPPSKRRNRKLLLIVLVLAAFVLGGLTAWYARDYFSDLVDDTSILSTGTQTEGTGSSGAPATETGSSGGTSEGKNSHGGGQKPGRPLPEGNKDKKENRVLIKDSLLPSSVVPVSYDLQLKAYLPGYGATISKEKNLTFDAEVTLNLTANESVDKIVLNALELDFDKDNSYVTIESGEMIKIKHVEKNKKLQHVTFTFEKKLPPGNLRFKIVYTGKIRSDALNGLYQTHYKSGDGTPKIAAATQMETLYARKMVPCFDEPKYKASWKVSIVHPKGTTALANGIELGPSEEVEDDFLITHFKETPAMSSYLLAILISEFGKIEKYTKGGVRFRIWARPEAMETAVFALEAGIQVLDGFADYFQIPFPLEKQDMVAIPDFAMGAMENWGLITYREVDLLYDAKNYFFNNKLRVATVIAHELAHQWFGNLVTMTWWDDIWLNEGFASYVENLGIEMIFDGAYSRDVIDAESAKTRTFTKDGKASSHPIVYSVDYVEEIDDLFDAINYQKGSAFLSMVNRVLGKAFDQGIANYLKKYAYKDTVHLDLFREWDKVIPGDLLGPDGHRLNVGEFAKKWTGQMNYPLLSLERVNKTHSRITQKRFKDDPDAKEKEKFAVSPFGYKWDVPVFIKQGDKKEYMKWLPAGGEIEIETAVGEPVVLNTDSVAIARTHYEGEGWKNIENQLEKDNTVYSEITKYRIISDVFAMAAVGKITYKKAFETVSYIPSEQTYLPWSSFLGELKTLKEYYGSLPERKVVESYQKAVLKPAFDKIDIMNTINAMGDDEGYQESKLQLEQYLCYCDVDKAACSQQTKDIYEQNFERRCQNDQKASDCGDVPTAIRMNVYCRAVENGVEETFELFLKKYKIELLQLERRRLMYALACTQNPVNIKWLLGQLVDRKSDLIRLQDASHMAFYISKNLVGREIVFNYLLSNWEKILESFSGEQSIINGIIGAFISPIRTRHELNQLENFIETEKSTKKYQKFTEALQEVKKKVEWLEKRGPEVAQLLEKLRS